MSSDLGQDLQSPQSASIAIGKQGSYSGPMSKNIFWTLGGNLFLVACQWGILTVLARWGSPKMVGNYSWGLALTAPIMILFSLSLRDIYVTDVSGSFSFRAYMSLRLISSAGALLSLLVVLTLVAPQDIPIALTIAIGITKVIESLSDLVHGRFQKIERMEIMSKSLMMRGLLSLLAFSTLLLSTGSVLMAASGAGLATLVTFLCFDLRCVSKLPPNRQHLETPGRTAKHLRSIFRTALPLGLAASSISLSVNIPRYFLGAVSGPASLGIYAVLAYPLAAGNIVASAVATVSLPRLTTYLANGDTERFWGFLSRLCILALVLGIGSITASVLLGEQFLAMMFGAEYARNSTTFILLVVGMAIGFLSWFLNSALTAAHFYRYAFMLEILSLAVTVALSWILIPKFGLIGTAWVSISVMSVGAIAKFATLKVGIPGRSMRPNPIDACSRT